jgi:hypothetical protein
MKGKYSTLVRRETTLCVRFFCTLFFVLSQLGAVGLRIMSRRLGKGSGISPLPQTSGRAGADEIRM